jgi:hypothetical protein
MMLACLTDAGRALTREMHGAMQRAQTRLLEALSESERRQFLRLLLKLVDTSEPGAPPEPAPRRAHAARDARKHATR